MQSLEIINNLEVLIPLGSVFLAVGTLIGLFLGRQIYQDHIRCLEKRVKELEKG